MHGTLLNNISYLCATKKIQIMIGLILYVVGIVLCVKAVLEVLKMPISSAGKAISVILLLVTSWIGLAVYYLYAKDHLTEWFK